jgi:hypothetical protein
MTPEESLAFPVVSANNKIVIFSINLPTAMFTEKQNNLYHYAASCLKKRQE